MERINNKMRLNAVFKRIIMVSAVIVATASLSNAVSFLYFRLPMWISIDGGSTAAIWNPDSLLINSKEGFGVYKVDSNGYLNDSKPLADTYAIAYGASYTAGKEVRNGKRFSDILNSSISTDGDVLSVYNVSQDGFYFPDMVRHFNCLVQQFSGANCIILETGTVSFDADELSDCVNQVEFKSDHSGEINRARKKPSNIIKEYIPLTNVAKTQLEAFAKEPDDAVATEHSYDESDIEQLKVIFDLLKSQFDGCIIVLYHPPVQITNDGLEIRVDENLPIFRKVCEESEIRFVDASMAFMETYQKTNKVPYGFNNSYICSGHLSESGHRDIAEALLLEMGVNS